MRNRFTPNEIRVSGNDVFITVYEREKKGKEMSAKCAFIIDKNDVEIARKIKWCVGGNGYVSNRKVGYLHHMLLPKKDGFVVDHINRNKLDNRRTNLRYLTHRTNLLNNSRKGYYWDKQRNRFRVSLMIGYRKVCGGQFKTEGEAKTRAQSLRNILINHAVTR